MSMVWRFTAFYLAPPALFLLSACGSSSGSTQAAERQAKPGELPSCYQAVKLPVDAPAPTRAVFVLVDQTTGLDEDLRRSLKDNVEHLLGPGTSFMVASFSAFSKGHHVQPLARGTFEAPVPDDQRPDLPVPKLKLLDQCLAEQKAIGVKQADQVIRKATKVDSSSFSNSEVLASLTQLSKAVSDSDADEKIVIIVSDLLEYSSATSFYRQQNLREIDPEAELAKAEKLGLIGDFKGATVYVIGAGLLSPESGDTMVRDARALQALETFWKDWFEKSGAELGEYGQPELVGAVRWAKTDKDGDNAPTT